MAQYPVTTEDGTRTTNVVDVPSDSSGVKQYVALLTQSGTDDPTAAVIVNTLGLTVSWHRQAQGVYYLRVDGGFNTAKTIPIIGTVGNEGSLARQSLSNLSEDPDNPGQQAVFVATVNIDLSGGGIITSDNYLQSTAIEIRVYP